MKWLIIGTGWISSSFIQALKNCGEEITTVFSRKEETGKDFAKKHDIKNVITEKVDGDFDAVYIGTPNVTHYDFAKHYIQMKKNVMVEKPMTHKYCLTKELYKLADEHGVRVMEAYTHVTQPEIVNIIPGNIDTNYQQLSSKIKNDTWREASSFSKEMFGGVIADLGVYPIAMSIAINGKVETADIKDEKFMNEVIVECDIQLCHENGNFSTFSLSKLKDGDNALYIDNHKIIEHISMSNKENRMDAEVKLFISNQSLDGIKEISLETARVIEELMYWNR